MTAEDRCTAEYPHPAHRTQYGPFGVKDCPGIPITPKNAPTVPDSPAPASTPPPRRGEFCHVHYSWLCQAGQGRCQAGAEHPADDEDAQAAVQNLLDDSTRAFAAADTSSERVEVIRDLLDGWYAAWPSTAVTDPHEGIAWQLASMISAAEAKASAPSSVPPRRAQEEPVMVPLAGWGGGHSRVPARRAQEATEPPSSCPETVWDGPYSYRCSQGALGGVCATHGRFRPAERQG